MNDCPLDSDRALKERFESVDADETLQRLAELRITRWSYRAEPDVEHIGPFGNEVKTEDRPMVQRWLVDQCQQLIAEFGIDGFRIDLAGQIDKQRTADDTLSRDQRVHAGDRSQRSHRHARLRQSA